MKKKPELTMDDLNKAAKALQEPALCKKCHKEITWTGSNWIHLEQPVDHLAVPVY